MSSVRGLAPRLELVESDHADPLSYRLWCSCGAPLGRLGLLAVQADGLRKTICENCGFVLAVDAKGQIVLHALAPAELLDKHGIVPMGLSRDVVSTIDVRKLQDRSR